jgi:hypothetical protein
MPGHTAHAQANEGVSLVELLLAVLPAASAARGPRVLRAPSRHIIPVMSRRPNVLLVLTDQSRYPPVYESEELQRFRREATPGQESQLPSHRDDPL